MARNEPPPLPPDPIEKPLPQHLEAERFLLAAILNNSSVYPVISELVKGEDFTIEPNRRIYRRIGAIVNRGETLEMVSLAEELKRMRELDLIGGLSYIVSLSEGMPKIAHPEVYAKIVREKSALRKIITLSRANAIAAMQQERTAEEIIADAQSTLNALAAGTLTDDSPLQTPEQVVESIGVQDFMEPWKKTPPISTGYPDLDDLIYGFIAGNVYVVGADSGDGKSTVAGSFIENLARAEVPSAWFTCEMDKQSVLHRMMCGRAGVGQKRFKQGNIDENDRARLRTALSEIMELDFLIEDTSGISFAEFETKLRRVVRERGIKVAILDYIQFMNLEEAGDGKHKFRDENHALSFISKGIARLARQLGISIVVLSQFNKSVALRKGKERRPVLNDLHGSSAMKKDATVVILLFREWNQHRDRDEIRKLVEFIIAKNRHGATGSVDMEFARGYTRFEQKVKQEQMNYAAAGRDD